MPLAQLEGMLLRGSLFVALLFTFASWGMPGHVGGGLPEMMIFTVYECSPPIEVEDFNAHLSAGTLENAIPWSVLSDLKADAASRLLFEQRIGFDFLWGSFISAEGEADMEERDAEPLTGTRSTLNLLKKAFVERGPQVLSQFQQNLISLNEHYHLFRVDRHDFKTIDSPVYERLFTPATLLFAREGGAIVLSADRRSLSICLEVERYKATTPRQDLPELFPVAFTAEKLTETVTHFIRSPEVNAILLCEELLNPVVRK